jgi:thioredoxin-dependent peroxiredoxin
LREYETVSGHHAKIMAELHIGSPAPALTVTLDDGALFDLATLYAKGSVLIYFYPKSGTPGCTRQACNLRDNFAALTARGLHVLGVSRDGAKAQSSFRARQNLPFRLIADTNGALGELFGVPRPTGGGYARQSFLVTGGNIAWIQRKAKPDTQASDAMAVLESLRAVV